MRCSPAKTSWYSSADVGFDADSMRNESKFLITKQEKQNNEFTVAKTIYIW